MKYVMVILKGYAIGTVQKVSADGSEFAVVAAHEICAQSRTKSAPETTGIDQT
jgi:hypothetical protein